MIDVIDARVFVLKTQHSTEKPVLEKYTDDADKKILFTSGLIKKQIITLLRLMLLRMRYPKLVT